MYGNAALAADIFRKCSGTGEALLASADNELQTPRKHGLIRRETDSRTRLQRPPSSSRDQSGNGSDVSFGSYGVRRRDAWQERAEKGVKSESMGNATVTSTINRQLSNDTNVKVFSSPRAK